MFPVMANKEAELKRHVPQLIEERPHVRLVGGVVIAPEEDIGGVDDQHWNTDFLPTHPPLAALP